MTTPKTKPATKFWTCRRCGFRQALGDAKICCSTACSVARASFKPAGDSRPDSRRAR